MPNTMKAAVVREFGTPLTIEELSSPARSSLLVTKFCFVFFSILQ